MLKRSLGMLFCWAACAMAAAEEPTAEPAVVQGAVQSPRPAGITTVLGTTHLRSDGEMMYDVMFSPDGSLVAAAGKQEIRVWETKSARLILHHTSTDWPLGELSFSADGKELRLARLTLRRWSMPAGTSLEDQPLPAEEPERKQAIEKLRRGKQPLRRVAVTGYVGGADMKVTVKVHEGERELLQFVGGQGSGQAVLSPDGKRLVLPIGSLRWEKYRVEVHDVDEKKLLFELPVTPKEAFHKALFLPDGETLLTIPGIGHAGVRRFDMKTGKPLAPLFTPPQAVRDIVLSRDGKRLLVPAQDRIYLIAVADGKILQTISSPGRNVSVAWSDGEKQLAALSDGPTLHLYDLETGRERFPHVGHSSCVWDVAFSPDGQTAATLAIGLYEWRLGAEPAPQLLTRDARTHSLNPQLARGVPNPGGPSVPFPRDLQYSSDGKRLAAWIDGRVLVWGREQLAGTKAFPGPGRARLVTAVSGDQEQMARTLPNGSIELWQSHQPLAGHMEDVYTLSFSPDGHWLASCGADKTIRIWSVEDERLAASIDATVMPWTPLAFSPDGARLATVLGTKVQVWNRGEPANPADVWSAEHVQKPALEWAAPHGAVSLAFDRDGARLWIGFRDGFIRQYDVAKGAEVAARREHIGAVMHLFLAADGKRLFSAGQDMVVHVWNPENLQQIAAFSEHKELITALSSDADSQWVASGDLSGRILVWKADGASDAKPRGELKLDASVQAVRFSSEDSLTCYASNRSQQHLSLETWQPTGASYGVQKSTMAGSFAFSPTEPATIALASPTTLQLWNVDTGQNTGMLPAPLPCDRVVTFSPDGKLVAGGGPGLVVWDLAAGRSRYHAPREASGYTVALAFSPDGRLLASAGDQHRIDLRDAETGRLLRSIATSQQVRVPHLWFTPDSRALAMVEGLPGPANPLALSVWEVVSGKLLYRRQVPPQVRSLAVTTDGSRALLGQTDGTSVLIELAGPLTRHLAWDAKEAAEPLALWTALSHEDPVAGWRAVDALVRLGDPAVTLLAEKLKPAPALEVPDAQGMAALVDQAIGDDPAAQREASRQLRRLGPAAWPALQSALAKSPSAAARARIELLLAAEAPSAATAARDARAVQALERLATPAALALLKSYAQGGSTAGLTLEARAAQARLAVKQAAK